MKTLVLGIGNPILTDDSVGIKTVKSLEASLKNGDVDFLPADIDGLSFLDVMMGYDRVVIIDSIMTDKAGVGTIHRLTLDDLSFSISPGSAHSINLATAIDLGRKLKLPVPEFIEIFAIESKDVTSFGENLTPELEEKFQGIVKDIEKEIAKYKE